MTDLPAHGKTGFMERLPNFNVVAIVDDTGAVQERYRYTPYGRRTALNANFTVHADPHAGGHAFAIGHQGLHHDGAAGAGLIYNRARMLHPALGRFVQRDPINQDEPGGGYQDGMSLYQYLRSNVHIWNDPSGLDCDASIDQWKSVTESYCDRYTGARRFLCRCFIGGINKAGSGGRASCAVLKTACEQRCGMFVDCRGNKFDLCIANCNARYTQCLISGGKKRPAPLNPAVDGAKRQLLHAMG